MGDLEIEQLQFRIRRLEEIVARFFTGRQWEAEDSYCVAGRGLVYSGKMPDPRFQLHERIYVTGIADVIGTINGIETFQSLDGAWPGKPVGVLLDWKTAIYPVGIRIEG